jgi:hypothetical protein
MRQNKEGFKNLIQIASCLDFQNSLAGNLLDDARAVFWYFINERHAIYLKKSLLEGLAN